MSAERRCSELKEDLQKVLDWIAGGQLVGFTIHTLLAYGRYDLRVFLRFTHQSLLPMLRLLCQSLQPHPQSM